MKIRKGTWETNSSSTHSIAISKEKVDIPKGKTIRFNIGEYGWENAVRSFPDYLYTCLLECEDDAGLEKLKSILDKWGVKYVFQKPKYLYWTSQVNGEQHRYLDYGHIDHCGEAHDIMCIILNHEDLLARALFGDSAVYTGNDNQDYDDARDCWCAIDTIWSEKEKKFIPNPDYDIEHYDYFFKGN